MKYQVMLVIRLDNNGGKYLEGKKYALQDEAQHQANILNQATQLNGFQGFHYYVTGPIQGGE